MRKSYKALFCVYCGEKATSEEHFPPESLTSTGYLFSACLECNQLASTQHPTSFVKRFGLVKERLISRVYDKLHKHDVCSKDWFEEVYRQKSRVEFSYFTYFSHFDLDLNELLTEYNLSNTDSDVKKCIQCEGIVSTRKKFCSDDCSKLYNSLKSNRNKIIKEQEKKSSQAIETQYPGIEIVKGRYRVSVGSGRFKKELGYYNTILECQAAQDDYYTNLRTL